MSGTDVADGNRNEIGGRAMLGKILTDRRLSIQALAKDIRISPGELWQILDGSREITKEMAETFGAALKMDPSAFLPVEDSHPRGLQWLDGGESGRRRDRILDEMHTHKADHTTFLFKGDLSGTVTLRRGDDVFQVPGKDLQSFFANVHRKRSTSTREGPAVDD